MIGSVLLPIRKHIERHPIKKFIALALVTLGVTVSARAQWIVYDPANTVQSVINTAQEIEGAAHPPRVQFSGAGQPSY